MRLYSLRITRLAENLLHSIQIKSKRRIDLGGAMLHDDSNYQLLLANENPYPKMKPMPVAQYTFGDSKVMTVAR